MIAMIRLDPFVALVAVLFVGLCLIGVFYWEVRGGDGK